MVNQRNVAALAETILDLQWDDYGSDEARDLAGKLAARGVLVPSALTDVEAVPDSFWDRSSQSDAEMKVWADEERTRLERIAKGEA